MHKEQYSQIYNISEFSSINKLLDMEKDNNNGADNIRYYFGSYHDRNSNEQNADGASNANNNEIISIA